jgi:hypothetical protein
MQPQAEDLGCVYWLFDARCVDPTDSGYIGVTTNLKVRVQHHREGRNAAARDLPETFSMRVLYEGPMARCLEIEQSLRPTADIGWNRMAGGVGVRSGRRHTEKTKRKISRAVKRGVPKGPKSPQHREAMRQAQLRLIAEAPEKYANKFTKMRAARALNDHSGINSKPKSEEHKQQLRLASSRAVCTHGHVKPFGKPCPQCMRDRKRRYRERLRSMLVTPERRKKPGTDPKPDR